MSTLASSATEGVSVFAVGGVFTPGPLGSTITPLTAPSASPAPPSTRCNVTMSPTNVAFAVKFDHAPFCSLNQLDGFVPVGVNTCTSAVVSPTGR